MEQQNEVIEEEEDEKEEIHRTVEQIESQIEQWKRVNQLEIRKEQLGAEGGGEEKVDEVVVDEDMEEEDELDVDDLDTILDWRAKNV